MITGIQRLPPDGTAQANPPEVTDAQAVPAQQAASVGSQWLPAGVQVGAAGSVGARQSLAPAGPAQVPAQQSSLAVQPAPTGRQASRQASRPAPSAMQRPPQHWAGTVQGEP